MLRKEMLLPFVIMFTLLISGCKTTSKEETKPSIPAESTARTDIIVERSELSDASKDIEANNRNIHRLSEDISKKSDEIIKDNPKIIQAFDIRKRSDNINFLSEDNVQNVEKLKKVNADLATASGKIKDLENTIIDKDKKIAEYNDKAMMRTRQLWTTVSTISGLIFIASICLTILYSPKIGVPIMMCAICCTAVSLFMVEYIRIVVIGGGVITLSLFGMLLYRAYLERKALKESIVSFEINKYRTWTEDAKKQVDSVQSDTTKKIVQEHRAELEKAGYYILSSCSSSSSSSSSNSSCSSSSASRKV